MVMAWWRLEMDQSRRRAQRLVLALAFGRCDAFGGPTPACFQYSIFLLTN